MKLSICNWNVLADCYVRGQNVEQTLANKAVSPTSWKYRSQLIRQALFSIQSDVYCLQEVDHYADFYRPLFHEMGYHSHYLPRPGGKRDGCLIAYPMHRFDAIEIEEVDLDRLAYLDHLERGNSAKDGRFALRSKYAKQNVALFILLQERKDCSPITKSTDLPRPTPAAVILATCHIHWNPNLPEVKFAQTQLVLEEMNRFQRRCQDNLFFSTSSRSQNSPPVSPPLIPMILSGDFNSFPHDDLYALVTGKITLLPQQYFLLGENNTATTEGTSTSTEENNGSLKTLNRGGRKFLKPLYGPNTKFLCDYSLSKLCRWMRILGIDVAMDSWENSRNNASNKSGVVVESEKPQTADFPISTTPAIDSSTTVSTTATLSSSASQAKNSSIHAFFQRARNEKRVILTSSKTLLERTLCPPSFYVHPNSLEQSLIHLYADYGLDLSRERFLTVCGKCGGEIEELADFYAEPRLMGKVIPTDRQIYACVQCAQPYWWNDEENSSPAKAMRKAEELYRIITKGLAKLSEQSLQTAASTAIPEGNDEEGEEEKEDYRVEGEDEEKLFSPTAEEVTDGDCSFKETDYSDQIEKEEGKYPLNLQEMFQRRNQIISEGLLTQTHSSSVIETEAVSSPLSSKNHLIHPALLPLQSIFQSQEPEITNWSGDFQGTLDYIFVSAEQIAVSFAQVFPQLDQNQLLRQRSFEAEIRRRIPAEIFHQRIEQSQPSLTWPSDHFLLYAELVISQQSQHPREE